MKLNKMAALSVAGLLFAALPVIAKPEAASTEFATIINTGSTNTSGYTLMLSRKNGITDAVWVTMPTSGEGIKNTSKPLVKLTNQMFRDLDAAMPLTSLPIRYGMRSTSFGTRTMINYKAQMSPDLTFASDPRTVALKADVDAITKTLHVGNVPRCPVVIDKNGAASTTPKN